jgi:2-phospho-L-lactate guanylyltransferase
MIATIVPIKAFAAAKSRLAVVLDPATRVALARGLFRHTLDVLAGSPSVARVVVVGEAETPLPVVRVTDPGGGLNAAIAAGLAAAGAADAILVLPADLPLLSAAAVERLVDGLRSGGSPQLVIAPDRRQDGTNALLASPPALVQPSFGPGSFRRHREAAAAAGARAVVHEEFAFSLDLDLPEDLAAIPPAIIRHLLALGAPERPPMPIRR